MNYHLKIAKKLLHLSITALLSGVMNATLLQQANAQESPPPDSEYHPNHLLVSFQPGTSDSDRSALHAAIGAKVLNTLDWQNLDVVLLPEGANPLAVAARYTGRQNVRYAHPNWVVKLVAHQPSTPNDPFYPQMWGLNNEGNDADIDAPEGWEVAFGPGNFPDSGGRRVGVLDTGIDQDHPDLAGKTKTCATAITGTGIITPGICLDDNSHGTHVAGTIASKTNNTLGVASVAPNAEFAIFKALNSAGFGFYADIIAGIQWLRTHGGSQIINMSIGGPQDAALDTELTEAYAAGTLLIAAAGNEADSDNFLNPPNPPSWPAFHPDVISVAATNRFDQRAHFSTFNPDVEISGPGVGIWSTIPSNVYARYSGTSMAAPHASGVAALVWWMNPGMSHEEVRARLNCTADDLGAPGRDEHYGHGRVNLYRALTESCGVTLSTMNLNRPAPSGKKNTGR